jgi:hypothetical protein
LNEELSFRCQNSRYQREAESKGLLYRTLCINVADPDHIDTDPDPAFYFDTDPDPTFHSKTEPDWG